MILKIFLPVSLHPIAYHTCVGPTCNGEYLQRTRPTDEQIEEPGNDFCEDAKLSQQRVLI